MHTSTLDFHGISLITSIVGAIALAATPDERHASQPYLQVDDSSPILVICQQIFLNIGGILKGR